MKSVLISIQPKWCELIANGKKTIEVRKTRPKLETPFKCFMYMTKDAKKHYYIDEYGDRQVELIPQKVIGEFVCDRIGQLKFDDDGDILFEQCLVGGYPCLTLGELQSYIGVNNIGYGWHISDLKIYDKPKELGEFRTICKDVFRQKYDGQVDYFCKDGYGSCAVKDEREQEECIYFDCSPVGGESCEYEDYAYCLCNGLKPLTRPFQSWGYVEE